MPNRRMELGALVALGIAVASGLIWLGQISQKIDGLETRMQKVEENQTSQSMDNLKGEIGQLEDRVENIGLNRFSKLPVGSIVPFAGELNGIKLYSRWKLCDGEKLTGEEYKDSPFYNTKLPNLDGDFLRATLSTDNLLEPGGSDTHSHPQIHTHELDHVHEGTTGPSKHLNSSPRDHHEEGGDHHHQFKTDKINNKTTTSPSPEVTGDTTVLPPFVYVHYLIKVI